MTLIKPLRSVRILLLAVIVAASGWLNAQNWSLMTTGTTLDLYDVHFASTTHGWACGMNGTIIATTDGGTTWAPQLSNTPQNLLSIHFPTLTHGWAVGWGGVVVATTNGGTTWTAQTTGTTANLSGVYFTDATTGYFVGAGGVLRKTTNGGTGWGAQSSGTTSNLESVQFISPTTGWVAGFDGKILYTTNGGDNWNTQTSGSTGLLYDVHFNDASNGWVVGFGGLIRTTTDGGMNWTGQTSGVGQSLHSVFFSTATKGWAAKSNGTLLTTSNGGTTWSSISLGSTSPLHSIFFISPALGWIAAEDGKIYRYTCTNTTGTDVLATCDFYTWIDGNTYTSSNNTATHTLTNAAGCDSVVTLNLTITSIDTTVSQGAQTLTANEAGATYQWVDCNNGNAPVPGETGQTFTPSVSGSYAVEITENGCIRMSSCHSVIVVGVDKELASMNFSIAPNPSTGEFAVELTEPATIQVMDAFGKVALQGTFAAGKNTIKMDGFAKGMYLVKVAYENKVGVKRLILN